MVDQNTRLEYAFGFTQDDLHANQKGRLADNQVEVLQAQQQIFIPLLIVVGFALFVIIVVSCAWMEKNLKNYLSAGILAVAVIGAFGLIAKKFIDYQKDIKQAKVECVCGDIGLDIIASRFSAHYALELGSYRFQLRSKEQLFAFENGGHYCIYYAPNSQHILAAEAQ
jgi:hypothetical protein